MSRRGRKPNQEPALAYDVRRCITLVQVLAMGDDQVFLDDALTWLCKAWGIDSSPSTAETIHELAQRAVEHYRQEIT